MKCIIAIADQGLLPVLKFLAAISILFLLSLAAMLVIAVGKACASDTRRAAAMTCVVQMQDKDLGAHAS